MDADAPRVPPPPERDAASVSPQHQRGSGTFVVVFSLCVLALLTGYRFAIGTIASDWYLFEVSRHTAWILDGVGYSAELEKNAVAGIDPAAVRARISGTAPAPSTQQAAPLSPWECWRYRALSRQDSEETGPRITFILWPGLQQAMEERERQLADAQSGVAPLAAEDRATLEQQVNMLKRRIEEISPDSTSQRERLGTAFTFYVVPSCGAIEIMIIFLAAVVAFPATWRHRTWGLALGLPLMHLTNIFRLACLACLGALDQGGAWFTFVHEYVWQAVYVIFVVLVWMAWVELGRRKFA